MLAVCMQEEGESLSFFLRLAALCTVVTSRLAPPLLGCLQRLAELADGWVRIGGPIYWIFKIFLPKVGISLKYVYI